MPYSLKAAVRKIFDQFFFFQNFIEESLSTFDIIFFVNIDFYVHFFFLLIVFLYLFVYVCLFVCFSLILNNKLISDADKHQKLIYGFCKLQYFVSD